jgi:putative PIN family toxin of toxin-antitoxin system
MRVVIDTCVWVSAIRSRQGASYALLASIPDGLFRFGVSVALFLEYKAKLIGTVTDGDSPLSLAQVDAILSALAYYAAEVPIYYQLRPNLKDENDNMVFECAANFGAEAIITHNVKDFYSPELRGYGLRPLTPGDFVMQIRNGEKQ